MKIKFWVTGFVMLLGLGFLFTPGMANAEENGTISIEEAATMIEFYDENGERYYPYTDEELIAFQKRDYSDISYATDSLNDSVIASSLRTYPFTRMWFTNNMYLKSGDYFYNPRTLVLNTDLQAANDIRVNLRVGVGGRTTHSIYVPGGWYGGLSIPLQSGCNCMRSVQLVNMGSGAADFRSGTLYYERP
ncbi:hypothetical protein [Evansella clarkii]|uniref:hypothetical protein n=1 Tax=Evansella clarkii TaxID=79879 RepID=UPI0009971335|nr:hypothetical protein [Evansella clarkii]